MAARWLPSNPEALRAALDGGLLTEGHFFDAKASLSPGKSGGRDLAVDIASFAIDGGVIVVGVREDKERREFELNPIPLAGLKERIDQVARSRIDPPVQVTCDELGIGDGLGYLVISVPASPVAPHMVDGRYRGRSDATNVVLGDAEVRRLHERAAVNADRAVRLLREEVSRDLYPEGGEAHLFVVAQPLGADPQLLLRHVNGNLAQWVRDSILHGAACRGAGAGAIVPDLGSHASEVSRRADGVALASHRVGPGRVALATDHSSRAPESGLLDFEVREDGGLRLYSGRASHTLREGKRLVIEALIAGLTLRTLLAAAAVAEATRYNGAWDLGLAVTNLRGGHAFSLHEVFGSRHQDVPYSAASYEQTVRVDTETLTAAPLDVLESLYGRLHRGLSGGGISLADLTRAIRP